MTESITSKTYDLWSLFYDHTFGALVRRRQKRAIAQLPLKPGHRVLDLGVGTGLLLQDYPRGIKLIGVDLSAGMLAKAEARRQSLGLTDCRLIQADALAVPLADASFDYVVITHVISVVSDPQKLLHEAARLVAPGGRILILNHFRSENRWIGWMEKVLNPIFVKIGWRSDLGLDEVRLVESLRIEYSFKVNPIDLWRIVVLAHTRSPLSAPPISPPISSPTSPLSSPPASTPALDYPSGLNWATQG